MSSLEALEFIIDMFNKYAQKPNDIGLFFKFCEAHDKVLKDLNHLEQLEKENQELKAFVNAYANARDELLIKNEQLEKALDLACERLNWDCPVSQDLIADLDCENRCTDDFEECCKECWKLYFLEVSKND